MRNKDVKVKLGFVPSHRQMFKRSEQWAKSLRDRALKILKGTGCLEIVAPDEKLTGNGLVQNEEDAEKVIQLFKEKLVDGIIIMAVDFGDEVSAARVASALSKPVILFATKEPPFTAEGERISDSFCGTISIGSALYRRKIPFIWGGIVFPEEEEFTKSVENFARTCVVVNGFLKARIGLIGPRPESFETCALDEVTLIRVFNQRVIPVSLVEAGAVVENVSDTEIRRITQSIRNEVDVSTVSEEALTKMARLEYSLLALTDKWRLDAMGIQCWGPMYRVFGVAPCHVCGRLVDRGIMVACEAYILGALTMLIQHLASFKKTSPHFIDWTVQHQEKENVFLAWHCGNAPPSLAKDRPKINQIGMGVFQLKPGIVTINRLAEYEGKFKMLVTTGRILESHQSLQGTWAWVEVADLKKLYEAILKNGFTHHASMIHGDYTKPIQDACEILGIEVVRV
ncbi:MAG: L-fucose/L-arabinose isomerase family protein [Thermoproteota archaeon]